MAAFSRGFGMAIRCSSYNWPRSANGPRKHARLGRRSVERELRGLRRVASFGKPSPPSTLFGEARRMRYQLALSAALAICLTAVTTARTSAQSAPEWRVGTGFLISRPNDARLWGVNAQREQSLTRLIVYRSAASVDFLGLAFDPT